MVTESSPEGISPSKAHARRVKKAKSGKRLSGYALYMKEELPRLKEEFPDMDHRERFKLVAKRWRTAKENPKNAEEGAEPHSQEDMMQEGEHSQEESQDEEH